MPSRTDRYLHLQTGTLRCVACLCCEGEQLMGCRCACHARSGITVRVAAVLYPTSSAPSSLPRYRDSLEVKP